MSRHARVEFPNAIYHALSRGNRRLDIVFDDHDRDHFWDRLSQAVVKFAWELFAAALMTNHFHLFLRTPEPNLSRGMQWLLGGYATWLNKRHRRSGHVFQARYTAQLAENESYFWNLSRYVHRNPYPILTSDLASYRWSTYGGYVGTSPRVPWVAYDTLLQSWRDEWGGTDSLAAYRRFVERDLEHRAPSPFLEAEEGWILGSDVFVEQVRRLISPHNHEPTVTRQRRLVTSSLEAIIAQVCDYYAITPDELARRGSRHPARPALAALARQQSAATFSELTLILGLARRDCVANLFRRVARDPSVSADVELISSLLQSDN